MIQRVFAGIVVDDVPTAGEWYEIVLGRAADAAPMEGLLEWHLPQGWLQVVDIRTIRDVQHKVAWGSSGSSSVAFVVDSLDDQVALLQANAIPIGPTYTTPTVKTATVQDPAGNLVTFVEELAVKR